MSDDQYAEDFEADQDTKHKNEMKVKNNNNTFGLSNHDEEEYYDQWEQDYNENQTQVHEKKIVPQTDRNQIYKMNIEEILRLNESMRKELEDGKKEIQELKNKKEISSSMKTESTKNRPTNPEQRKKLMLQFKKNNQRILNMQNEELYKLMLREEEFKSETYLLNLVNKAELMVQHKKKLQKTVTQLKHELELGGKQFIEMNNQNRNKTENLKLLIVHAKKETEHLEDKGSRIQQKIQNMNTRLNQITEQLNQKTNLKQTSEEAPDIQMKYRRTRIRFEELKNECKVLRKNFSGKEYILRSEIQFNKKQLALIISRISGVEIANGQMINQLGEKNSNGTQLKQLINDFMGKLNHFNNYNKKIQSRVSRRQYSKDTIRKNEIEYQEINRKINQLKKTKKVSLLNIKEKSSIPDLYLHNDSLRIEFPSLTPTTRQPSVDILNQTQLPPQQTKTLKKKKSEIKVLTYEQLSGETWMIT